MKTIVNHPLIENMVKTLWKIVFLAIFCNTLFRWLLAYPLEWYLRRMRRTES